ncbi:hypothetical protein [Candidatus Uabimicrobium sp. HlEnr_7]
MAAQSFIVGHDNANKPLYDIKKIDTNKKSEEIIQSFDDFSS